MVTHRCRAIDASDLLTRVVVDPFDHRARGLYRRHADRADWRRYHYRTRGQRWRVAGGR